MTRYAPLWLQSGSYAAGVDRRLIGALWPSSASSGLAVSSSGTGMGLNVAPGSCAIPAANQTGSVLCASDAIEVVTLEPAPAAGTNRIDLVICQARGADLDGGTNNDFVFTYVKGAEAASPVAPAAPAGALALASVYVGGGVASIAAGNITDTRPGRLGVNTPFAPVQFRAAHGVQSIPRVAFTDVTTWGTPAENVGGGGWAGGIYTIPATGRYQMIAALLWQLPNTSGWVGVQTQLAFTGGSQLITSGWMNPAGANVTIGLVVCRRNLNAGDTVKVQAYNGHPSAAVSLYGGYMGLEIERVG